MKPSQSSSVIIGKITIFPKVILGDGSNSKVRVGSLDGRPVAVKRVPFSSKDPEKELNEIDMLLKCDGHENVIKYYTKEIYNNEFIYIALELCDGNLDDWVKKPPPLAAKHISKAGILEQTTKGVEYLHSLGIIHRDLKPENILLSILDGKNVRVKITDFGISQKLDQGEIAKTIQTGAGTIGWMAPEILLYHLNNPQATDSDKLKMTRQTDIFQLGCVFYFVLSNGNHPFGTNFIMQFHNITKGTPTLSLTDMEYEHVGSARLIQVMIANDPTTRPSASVVLSHHLFWSNTKILNFLTDVSNVTDNRPNLSKDIERCLTNMEQHYSRRSLRDWVSQAGPEVKDWIRNNGYRSYKTNDIMDLVRVIRNMKGHFDRLPLGTKQEIGNSLDGLVNYWCKRFPFLVDMIWLSFDSLGNKPEYNLADYYCKTREYQFRELSKEEKEKFDGFMESEYLTETMSREMEKIMLKEVRKLEEWSKPSQETVEGANFSGNGEKEGGSFSKRGGLKQNQVPKWVNKGETGAAGNEEEKDYERKRGNMRKAQSYGDLTEANDVGDVEGVKFNDDHAGAFKGRGHDNGWKRGEYGGQRRRGQKRRSENNFRGQGRGNRGFMGGNEIWVRLNGPNVMMGGGYGAGFDVRGRGGNYGGFDSRTRNEWGNDDAGFRNQRGFNNGRRGGPAGFHFKGNNGRGRGFPQRE